MMKRRFVRRFPLYAGIFLTAAALHGQKKLAQTGFEFLSVGSLGRASGMGDAYTCVTGTSTALLYNPAGLAGMSSAVDLSASRNRWIADITHFSFTAAFRPWKERYGVVGLSALWVDYGEFLGTMVWNNGQGYIDTEVFTPKAMALGIGYAKSLTDKFSVGGQIKWVAQSSGRNVVPGGTSGTGLTVVKSALSSAAFDFGTLYRTGFKSLNFGMSVRNFSKEIQYVQEGFQLPFTFRMGLAMNVLDLLPNPSAAHAFNLAADLVHPRSHDEYFCLGGEYLFLNTLALRAGIVTGQDETGATYGFGIQRFGLAVDYAVTPFGVFDNVQRLTVRVSR
jgi:hypothetical protein